MATSKRIPYRQRIGQRFGRLVVLDILPGDSKHPRAHCQCDCGDTHDAAIDSIIQNTTASCGCLRKENTGRLNRQHGLSHTNEWRIWIGMIDRCYRPTSTMFPLYGARGVTVCDRWRYSFENFYADMGQRPSLKHSIDRIDPNGPYSPENCRWATAHEQRMNQRRMHT